MAREVNFNDLQGLLKLYTQLHDNPLPEESTLDFYEQCGYNRNDKTAFIQWLNP